MTEELKEILLCKCHNAPTAQSKKNCFKEVWQPHPTKDKRI
jgi:hypothetical protein